jgi:hypothetical protein
MNIEHSETIVKGILKGQKGLTETLVPFAVHEPLLDNGVQVARISDRIRKLEQKRHLNRAVAGKIAQVNKRVAGRIASCSTVVERYDFDDDSDLFHSRHYCASRFCAVCAGRRSRRMVGKYAPIVRRFSKGLYGSHVVLTLANSDTLPERALISRSVRNLFRRRFWKQFGGVAGGFYSVETTISSKGQFHLHVHALVFTRLAIPSYRSGKWEIEVNQELSDEWLKVTKGGGYIVRGQTFDGRIFEMLKYMVKQSEVLKMDDKQLNEFLEWCNGTRVVSAFGGLYGLLPEIELDDETTDMEGEPIIPCSPGRRLIRKTVLEYDESLECYVPIGVEEFNPPLTTFFFNKGTSEKRSRGEQL